MGNAVREILRAVVRARIDAYLNGLAVWVDCLYVLGTALIGAFLLAVLLWQCEHPRWPGDRGG